MISKIIGLAGSSGCGKDLVADYICDRYGYKKYAIGDFIRDEIRTFLLKTFNYSFFEYNFPTSFNVVIETFIESIYKKPTTHEMRVFQQWWGFDYMVQKNPRYWIDKLDNAVDKDSCFVVSDIRLITEIQYVIHELKGEVWLFERSNLKQVGIPFHMTEYVFPSPSYNPFSHIIENNGTKEEIYEKIDFLFHEC